MGNLRSTTKQLGPILWTFLKIAPVTFGGGYAMIPVLEKEAVHKQGWIKQEEISDVLAVSQTIPGAVALNAASFIGYRVAGISGAVMAVIGMMLPTFLIVTGLATLLLSLQDNVKVAAALQGMKPAVVAMIVYAGYRVSKTALTDKWTTLIAIAAAAVLLLKFVSPILVILLGALAGIGIGLWKNRHGGGRRPAQGPYREPDYFIGEGI
ncbi:chromate transporter [Paenibacillus oceani]|uniref:Chromate transporter n=1 Tax=Paenibacillus oceani TaxID=2772510 RepID=A0A927C611_9BACL|nr:chromate transporter [Paenibacillus oceani]MBD2862018.1 chromate transporter [Paenibacillus oceani]